MVARHFSLYFFAILLEDGDLVNGQTWNKNISRISVTIVTDKPKALKHDSIYNIDMLFWKKGFQAFIYISYKSFDIHICSSRTGSFYAFYTNRLK